MARPHSVYLVTVEGRLGGFHLLAITNSAAMHIIVYESLFEHLFSVLLAA